MEPALTIDEIKRIASEIAQRHGVERMFLFGSYARGDAKPDSDLDFRIDRGRIRGLFALGGLYADLEEAFRRPIDLLTTESLDADFRRMIAAEEVRIYG
ncbi:MAG: nucleotidyltransferase family protein [Bacillota bacterium]